MATKAGRSNLLPGTAAPGAFSLCSPQSRGRPNQAARPGQTLRGVHAMARQAGGAGSAALITIPAAFLTTRCFEERAGSYN